MRNLNKILLFVCFLGSHLTTFGQEQEYLQAEQERISQVQNIEKDIADHVAANISNYTLSQEEQDAIVNSLAQEYDGIQNIPQQKLEEAILSSKEFELRRGYFANHPEINNNIFVALPFIEQNSESLCFNSGFEAPENTSGYTFVSRRFRVHTINETGDLDEMLGCSTTVDLGPNSSSDYYTLVTSNVAEPFLDSILPIAITRPTTVFNGSHSVKLNQSSGARDITAMSRTYHNLDSTATYSITFNFLSIMTNGHQNDTSDTQPFFKVEVYNDNVFSQTICFRANDSQSNVSTSFGVDFFEYFPPNTIGSIRYTPVWQTKTFDIAAGGTEVTIVFTVGDCKEGGHFSTTYFDDICLRQTSCQSILSLSSPNDNVSNSSSNAITLFERHNWIKATNQIAVGNNNFQDGVVYHAGDYVELNPGFEALYGSQFAAYPKDCDGIFTYKTGENANDIKNPEALKQKEQLIVYPNPTNGFVTMSYRDKIIQKVTVNSIDGKSTFFMNNEKSSEYRFDMTNFSDGIYILSVETQDGQIINSKLVKN